MQVPILVMDISICLLFICFSVSARSLPKEEIQNMHYEQLASVLTSFLVKLNRIHLCQNTIEDLSGCNFR